MLPDASLLPDVLPTERLQQSGMPVPAMRASLRRISNARSAVTVVACLLQTFGVVAAAMLIGRWWAYVFAFLWMGRGHCLLNILGHEAAHRLLFTWRWLNDGVGKWLLAYPTFQAFTAYRRVHFAHHKDEMGPDEPDLALYSGYPIPPDSMRRKLTRDLFFISGYEEHGRPRPSRASRRAARRGASSRCRRCCSASASRSGSWWVYPVIWVAPWMTLWKFSNRLRAIAEHAGMTRSKDRRLTTHVVRQTRIARLMFVPYNTGWHLAHHVDMGVPWRHLPQLHAELVRSGWVTEELTYPTYRALWKQLASGAPRSVVMTASAS